MEPALLIGCFEVWTFKQLISRLNVKKAVVKSSSIEQDEMFSARQGWIEFLARLLDSCEITLEHFR